MQKLVSAEGASTCLLMLNPSLMSECTVRCLDHTPASVLVGEGDHMGFWGSNLGWLHVGQAPLLNSLRRSRPTSSFGQTLTNNRIGLCSKGTDAWRA